MSIGPALQPRKHLCRYLIPGGSAGHFKREGYTFDVGSSMMFGFGNKGTTNLITRCLKSVGKSMVTVPDPSQVLYHLPKSTAHPQVCQRKEHLVACRHAWHQCHMLHTIWPHAVISSFTALRSRFSHTRSAPCTYCGAHPSYVHEPIPVMDHNV